ncbi:putative dipeptidase [Kineothrix alysoides]|uniref:Putative dipeptidase n=1 Tax=Kineothrix alysoides TaxID=1469948 RepID=A0A4R1QYE4_9FIRM|nr:Sapep family Mn(2+)-dependent dipeptidase [Kineothrix alysoides]TCL57300.1 putative dipeptidase [Kineothrix alysoides]
MKTTKDYLKNGLDDYKEQILYDIGRLVAVPSVYDNATAASGRPFGAEIRKAFDLIIEMAEKFSLKWQDFDGYALHIDYGENSEVLGILTHTDVVPCKDSSQWLSEPFTLSVRDGFMYGRGVNDDKSAIIGILYIMRLLKEAAYQPSKKIRLIIGGAEETTWECMDYYLKRNAPPQMSFSPDCDFPVVNCEKGVLRGEFKKVYDKSDRVQKRNAEVHQLIRMESNISHNYTLHRLKVTIRTADISAVENCAVHAVKVTSDADIITLTYLSPRNLSRNPQRAVHAAHEFARDFIACTGIDYNFYSILERVMQWFQKEPYGAGFGIKHHHSETGDLTMALCYLSYTDTEKELLMGFDIRYPMGIEEDCILAHLNEEAAKEGFQTIVIQKKKRLYVSPDDNLVHILLDSYESVTGERPLPVTKGGISYSRAVPNCVGFGPSFPRETPNSHGENECMKIESYFKALDIYAEAIIRLNEDQTDAASLY